MYKPPVVVPLYLLKKYRIEASLTQDLVAQGLNLSFNRLVSDWEKGKKRMPESQWGRFLTLVGRPQERLPTHGLFSAATAPARPSYADEVDAMTLQDQSWTEEDERREAVDLSILSVVELLLEERGEDKLLRLFNQYPSNRAIAVLAWEAGHAAGMKDVEEQAERNEWEKFL